MMMLSFQSQAPREEAAMSSIQVLQRAAGQATKTARVDLRPARYESPDKSQVSDREMMYAWSIGVTTAARSHAQVQEHPETCPPEVYIG